MKAVVVIPTYNERANIILVLEKLATAAKKIPRHMLSYLVVDDNSPDGTQEVVRQYQKKHPEVKLLTGKKEGLGKALLRGDSYAISGLGAEVLVQMDADLSHDPSSLPVFFEALDRGADFVVGSRYIPGGSIPNNWGIHRKVFSIMANAIVRFGLGHPKVHDWTGGYRLYKKEFFEKEKKSLTQFSGYLFQIAFLDKATQHGAKVVEVPIQFTDRLYGHSKIPVFQYIPDILRYVMTNGLKSFLGGSFSKFLAVGGIGFILNALILVLLHDRLSWSASLANIVGAGVAIFSNYNLNNLWTFRINKISRLSQYFIKLIQFYATSLFGVLVIQTGTIALGTRFLGDRNYFIYFLVGTAFLLAWNYFMYSQVIWKRNKAKLPV